MDDVYRYPLDDDATTPQAAFDIAQSYIDDIQTIMVDPTPAQEVALERFLANSLAILIFGSNQIERVGCNKVVTLHLCKHILAGKDVNVEPRSKEYEEGLKRMIKEKGRSGGAGIVRERAEVVQHALTLKYIVNSVVLENEPVTEAVILETHRILCHDIPLDDGSGDKYAGEYRTVPVVAGFSSFTPPDRVPAAMRKLVKDLRADVLKAEIEGELDHFMLAAIYCHKFVNIHPLVDGNGRVCRLLLNAILLKYAGIVVPLGEKGEERDEYLNVAAARNLHEQDEDDEGFNAFSPPWAELATMVVSKSAEQLEALKEHIQDPSALNSDDDVVVD
jgi:Fic family protein